MKQFDWKKLIPYGVAFVAFFAFALIYCAPLLQGKVMHAGDTLTWAGGAQEAREYNQTHDDTTWWTNSMFGGMPTFQLAGRMPSGVLRSELETITHLGFNGNKAAIGFIFAYFFGFFLMLLCFGVNPWLSTVGAFAIGLSSYFFLILPAGHMTKSAALGLLAPVIGGFYATMRGKYWLGVPLILVYSYIAITLHTQMTYYFLMLIGIMACVELYIHIREQRWKDLGIGVGILVICALLVFGTKLSWFQMNNEYLKETMRGGHSELNQAEKQESMPGSRSWSTMPAFLVI